MNDLSKLANDRLNPQVLVVQTAQDKIREIVKDYVFLKISKSKADKAVTKIILASLGKIGIPDLQRAVKRSLIEYYNRQRRIAKSVPSAVIFSFLCLAKLLKKDTEYTESISLRAAREEVEKTFPKFEGWRNDNIKNLGNALGEYHTDYLKNRIIPLTDKLAEEEALDPDSVEKWGVRSSLRNRAEREVRYEGHLENIEQLRDAGHNLVIISSHADCSKRCRPFQGRVFSLDGTSGRTDDGREFVPLEVATDIPTPNGKWMNGLFGFNCRHYAVAYSKGYVFPKTSKAVEKKEYAITQKQRYMERQVRQWRIKAEMTRGIDAERHSVAVRKARSYNERYVKYSQKHNRAYYSSRTAII